LSYTAEKLNLLDRHLVNFLSRYMIHAEKRVVSGHSYTELNPLGGASILPMMKIGNTHRIWLLLVEVY